jgi:glycosyltransferase involved in cell wall biosynthesis
VGRADYWKRPLSFIRLAQALPKERLVMICRKGKNAKLFNQVKKLAAEQDNVKFFSAVPIEEITKYFKQAKLFVNTSTAEGFPNTFMQSGLTKTPVLSLTVNPDDYLKRLNCGLTAKNNQKLLIKKCKRIIKNPRLIKTMGQNHYDYIIKNHSFRNINIFKKAICEKLLV